MRRVVALLAVLVSTLARADEDLVIGSKLFTESVILGEIIAQTAAANGATAEHRDELGGSQILFNALRAGEIDAYPEYTGTIRLELLRDLELRTDTQVAAALARLGVRMTWGLGFNNTYALGMTKARAAELGVRTASDLLAHPGLRFGFSNEFLDRGDGWPALSEAYAFPQRDVRGLDHALAYRALVAGDLDVIDLYSTDAEIAYYDLAVLEDDRRFFPRYDAVVLYRADVAVRFPEVASAWDALAGTIDEPVMIAMNERAKLERAPSSVVAADHLRDAAKAPVSGVEGRRGVRWGDIVVRTREHLWLVGASMGMAVVLAIPLGVWAALRPGAGQVILAVVGVAQTIPSLALLVVLIRPLGLGDKPAIAALFVYALLPMVRATQSGLASIPKGVTESARAAGLGWATRLRVIEVPMAARSVLAGVKTSTVITIGFATLGAWVGAGGYGKPILTGIRLDDFGLILEGALPAAVMALGAQWVFELIERVAVPRGLRRAG